MIVDYANPLKHMYNLWDTLNLLGTSHRHRDEDHLGSARRHLDNLHLPPAGVPVGEGGPGTAPEHGLLSVPITHSLEIGDI